MNPARHNYASALPLWFVSELTLANVPGVEDINYRKWIFTCVTGKCQIK